MRTPFRGTLALATVLALLAGCETTPKPAAQAAAVPVETRSVSATPAAATAAPAATAGVAPQSRVATVDLGATRPAATGATAIPLSRPPGVGPAAAGGTAAAAGTALMAVPRDRVVFFDFDSFVIKEDFKGLLDAHAKALAGNRAKRMTVEGHTDERGGREYNLALGQKRADAVVKALTLLGVSEQQLEAVSFGEERPLQQGSDETAWSRNRRAELKDR